MKTYSLYFLLIIFFISCSDEDKTLTPSYADINWFELSDSPDELGHMCYEIYKNTNISVFYSDTIGRQFRGIDGYGDSIIHYEIINPQYTIASATSTITYILSYDRNAIRDGIMFLRDKVIPVLSPNTYPRSFLIVENLTLNATSTVANGQREGQVFNGLMTTLVSNISKLSTMSSEDQTRLAKQIASPILQTYLNNTRRDELENFYAVSDNSVTWPADALSTTAYQRLVNSTIPPTNTGYLPYREHWNAYGFLISNPNSPGTLNGGPDVYTKFTTPTQAQDVISFIEAVLTYSETEFQALYENTVGYEFLIEKYRMIKKLLDEVRNNH